MGHRLNKWKDLGVLLDIQVPFVDSQCSMTHILEQFVLVIQIQRIYTYVHAYAASYVALFISHIFFENAHPEASTSNAVLCVCYRV